MKRQPGNISTQLHRGVAGSCVFLNYAAWESVDHFRAAFTHPPNSGARWGLPVDRGRATALIQPALGTQSLRGLNAATREKANHAQACSPHRGDRGHSGHRDVLPLHHPRRVVRVI
ncbi:MAG TPA: antibiotic biosynthesis monooxygenase [Burkholderiaceae bacterium]|nr:antibiotic biosynthesis monooxygenase [Burkholderiaceae bacterium]